ncbi:MAG TPA: hypothetical protein VG841_10900 [Caulobacterales bacterium]|nr:hypothetical protein [Caulobacterales bacterium]
MQATDAYLIDLKPLVAAFRETDDHMPRIVFTMLEHYLDHGPFEFDATQIAEWLQVDSTSADRLNPEKIAALQPEIETFFENTPRGLAPRRGVLASN